MNQPTPPQTPARVAVQVAVRLPRPPSVIELDLRASSLAQAQRSGEYFSIDVAQLDEPSIEAVIAAWSEQFRAHARERRLAAQQAQGAPL